MTAMTALRAFFMLSAAPRRYRTVSACALACHDRFSCASRAFLITSAMVSRSAAAC